MISNTELFYVKAKQFQDKRREIEEGYEKNLKALERFKGSKGYEDELTKAKEKHEADLTALRDEYRPTFLTIFGGMMDAIGKRTVNAPTNDQINLLNVLKMKKKVTLEDCQRIAEAVKDNPIAVSVVTEIAHDHGIMRSFDDLCPEMSSQRAIEVVTGMKDGLEDWLMYDTTKASRMVKAYHEEHYGASETPLTKRKMFENQTECFRDLVGLEGESMKQFSEIVDATEGGNV